MEWTYPARDLKRAARLSRIGTKHVSPAGTSQSTGACGFATVAAAPTSTEPDKRACQREAAAGKRRWCDCWLGARLREVMQWIDLQFGDQVDEDRPLQLAPRWLERVMAFVYPASLAFDEGIAHLWLRAEVAMNTQCGIGGCAYPIFACATALRWGCSAATSFWLVFVFRRCRS